MGFTILVTGASGFVGSAVAAHLAGEHDVIAAVRRETNALPQVIERRAHPDLESRADWRAALRGAQCIVHAAARVHIVKDSTPDPLNEYRKANVAGTLALARQAADAGVRRFIFISSIKVNGESTEGRAPYSPDELPRPADPYGLSKHEAENGLRKLCASTGMELTIVRPPLVYGPHVKGHFLGLMRWIRSGIPLPFGAIGNKRSMAALGNVVHVVAKCVATQAAAGQVFLVSDEEDLSTREIAERLSQALGKRARLIPVPPSVLMLGGRLVGRQSVVQRLCQSLQVDVSKTRRLLGWQPVVSVAEGMRQAAEAFLRGGN